MKHENLQSQRVRRDLKTGVGEHGKNVIVKNIKRSIACISDIHAGSYYALFPEGFRLKANNRIELNEGQRELLSSYYQFMATCDDLNVDTVLVVGDMVHGQNLRGAGTNLIVTDLNTQQRAAGVLLEPLLKGRKSYWVAGSQYHRSTPGHNPDEGLCAKIGNKAGYHTMWCDEVANLIVGEKVINLTHGGSGAFIYRETAMAREIGFSKMAFANNKLPKISTFVHGHWHWFAYLHEYEVHYVQVPCWIAYEPTPIFTKNYARFQPDIGAVVILIDSADRITVWHFLYPLPHIADKPIRI